MRSPDAGVLIIFRHVTRPGQKRSGESSAQHSPVFVAENIVNKIIGNKIYNSIVLSGEKRED
jgi:hypothetical protein